MLIKSFDTKKQKKVAAGTFENDIFYKRVSPQHYMYKEKGYGISLDVIKELQILECKKIIVDTGSQELSFNFEDIVNLPPKDYGHGQQVFLPAQIN